MSAQIVTLADYRRVAAGDPTRFGNTPAYAMLHRLAREFEFLPHDPLSYGRFSMTPSYNLELFGLNYRLGTNPVVRGLYQVDAVTADDCIITAEVFELDQTNNRITYGLEYVRTLCLSSQGEAFASEARALMLEWAKKVAANCRVMGPRVEMRSKTLAGQQAQYHILGLPPIV